eukprot:6172039-Pleurochrysis_carterae.AAC.1
MALVERSVAQRPGTYSASRSSSRCSDAVGNFDAHIGVALRDAVGRKEAAIAAYHACRAAVNKCNSRVANSARQNRRLGRRSGRCKRDWHWVCGLKKKKQDEKEGRSSSSDNRAQALHDGDAQRRLR